MIKTLKSPAYNYIFNINTGFFARWGKTKEDDPPFSPIGPEIADIEISTICHGVNGPCNFCYKSNTSKGKNMSLDTFKTIFKKLPVSLTQIAFGIGDIDSNPEMFDIFKYCRDHNIIPNVTINGSGLTDECAKRLSELCGAVAVSRYTKYDVCFDAVKKLTDLGMKQVNIHFMLSQETYVNALETLYCIAHDTRLSKLNAIVFLGVKPKGKAIDKYTPIKHSCFCDLIARCMKEKLNFGFDSCLAPKFLHAMHDHPQFEEFKKYSEPCESSLFSTYINVDGDFFPCSFMEGVQDWEEGLSVVDCKSFMDDIWFHPKTKKFREVLLETESKETKNCFSPCRKCPAYEIY